MGIGTSKGAYYDDEFHHAAAQWDDKYDENVIHPNKMQVDRMLDDAELDPSTGMGIEVDYKVLPDVGPSPLSQAVDNFKQQAAGPYKPLKDTSPEDIDTAINLGMAFSGGGLKLGSAPEKIGKAALQYGDDIFEGTNHGMAFEKLMEKYKDIKDYGKVKDGFMTSNGRFVSREEAMEIAKSMDQLVDKGLPPNVTGLLSEDLIR